MTDQTVPDWVFPAPQYEELQKVMAGAEELANALKADLQPRYRGEWTVFEKRDTRYLYFMRVRNIALGLMAIINALQGSVNRKDFFGFDPGHDAADEKRRIMNHMVSPILAWGTMLNWWGNYEHSVLSVCTAAKWPLKGKPGLHRLTDIASAVVPNLGTAGQKWREHWDISSTLRNLVHNGGIYNPSFHSITLRYHGQDIAFKPGKAPNIARSIWVVTFRDSIVEWGSLINSPSVRAIDHEIADTHCGAYEP
jgi:hypothetical protein